MTKTLIVHSVYVFYMAIRIFRKIINLINSYIINLKNIDNKVTDYTTRHGVINKVVKFINNLCINFVKIMISCVSVREEIKLTDLKVTRSVST